MRLAACTTLQALLALDEFASGRATFTALQDLLDTLLMADALARQGVGPELRPLIDDAAAVLARTEARRLPWALAGHELERLRDVLGAHVEQLGLATPGQLLGAQVVLAGRRRGWVKTQ